MVNRIKLLIGMILVSFGFLGIAVEIDNQASGKSDHPAVGIALVVLCLASGAWLLRSARRAPRESPSVKTHEGELSRSNVVLRVAREKAGRITASEVAANTTISFDAAKNELERLTEAGACTIDVGENGVRVYYFPEFESPDKKRDIVA